jgi:hypothetical protein
MRSTVSPLLREHLRIGVCPDRLIVAGYSRGLRPALARRQLIPLEPADDPSGWQRAVAALPAALAELQPGRGEVTLVLSNHFVRYALLPWNKGLRTRAEWDAFARHRLAAVHGSAVESWDLRLTETGPRGPRIACAVEHALLDALDAALEPSGAALVSVQPYLMAAFNRVRRELGNTDCWLVVEEPGRLTLALIERGSWRAIRSRRVDERWRHSLGEILERESAVLGLEHPCTQVAICSHEEPDPELGSTLTLRDLTLPRGVALDDRSLAMALG